MDKKFKSNKNKTFRKSVSEAALGNLTSMIDYKSRTGGREVIKVNSRNTTKTCSTCGSLTGPAGLSGLAVRHWRCSACGAYHDRDINSAMIVLNVGLGMSHELAVVI